MRLNIITSAIGVFALTASASAAQEDGEPLLHHGSSEFSLHPLAREPGAISEVRVRVPWESVQDYLTLYGRWFQPIDQLDGSGRSLLTLLQREHGDEFNFVFLYWYQSSYKQDYYCSYSKKFFEYHSSENSTMNKMGTHTDFLEEFADVISKMKIKATPEEHLKAVMRELSTCTDNKPPLEASELIRRFDAKLRAYVILDEGLWSFGVNPCRAMVLEASGGGEDTDTSQCDASVIEEAVTQ